MKIASERTVVEIDSSERMACNGSGRPRKSNDGQDDETRKDLKPGDPGATGDAELRWHAYSCRGPEKDSGRRAERAQRVQHAALALYRGAESGAEETPAGGGLQPGQGGRGIRGDCGVRRRGRMAERSRRDAVPWAGRRDARGICGAGEKQRAELPLAIFGG